MNIIIPLGGLGNRFKNYGYSYPKPLINAMGQPILYWLLSSLDFTKIKNILIPYNKELSHYRFEEQLKKDFPQLNFIFKRLNTDTRGASETILRCLEDFDDDSPIISVDGDSFFLENIINKWHGENCIYVFESYCKEPIYSYSKIDNNLIIDIKEKNKISDWASAGIYGFESSKLLKSYCKQIIDKNIKEKNEFYISVVIQEMIKEGYSIKPKFINNQDIICLGSPLHLRLFSNNYYKINEKINKFLKRKKYCFDLDNTLVTYPVIDNDYSSVLPIEKNIKLLKHLKNMGNEIIIYTARRMKTHKGNIGKITADIGKITIDTLEKFDIPYDELHFGKPYADYYVDDLGISAFSNLEKMLGFYDSDIDSRYFNKILLDQIETVKKQSTKDLSGEIYYYQNIPDKIKDLFPIFLRSSHDNKFYEIEKINGIPISKLYVSGELTKNQLTDIINCIRRIHSSHYLDNKKHINIYLNYSKKLIERYHSFNYSKFNNSFLLFQKINKFLKNYEKNECGKSCVIHGDPVFTNILIDEYGKIKFIDMRGKLGDDLTIIGDSMYDWAKIYQSLIGYDEILEDTQLHINYKQTLINHFENIFLTFNSEEDLKNLKIITQSLLFTLIPVHNNQKCHQYYDLIHNI